MSCLPFHNVWAKKAPSMKNRPSPDTETASALTLDFPASRTMSNKFLMFINYPVFLRAAQTKRDLNKDFFKVDIQMAKRYI